jgi:hypothetical protein
LTPHNSRQNRRQIAGKHYFNAIGVSGSILRGRFLAKNMAIRAKKAPEW